MSIVQLIFIAVVLVLGCPVFLYCGLIAKNQKVRANRLAVALSLFMAFAYLSVMDLKSELILNQVELIKIRTELIKHRPAINQATKKPKQSRATYRYIST